MGLTAGKVSCTCPVESRRADRVTEGGEENRHNRLPK
jgi:hypothetical protein